MSVFHSTPDHREQGDRFIKLVWNLGETVDHLGQPVTAAASLFVGHSKNRKEYIAHVQRVDRSRSGDFAVESFTMFGGARVRLASQPTARFSAKGLSNAVVVALAELRDRASESAIQSVADAATAA